MNKMKLVICSLLMLVMLSGCNSENPGNEAAAFDASEISSVIIEYDVDGLHHKVDIDFDSATRTTTIFGDEAEEFEEDFLIDEKCREFAKQLVEEEILKEESSEESDTKQVLWAIRIWVGEECYNTGGFEEDGYPAYWEEVKSVFLSE